MGLWKYIANKIKPWVKDEIKAEVYAELINSPDIVAKVKASCDERIAQINSASDTVLNAILDRKTGLEKTVSGIEAKAAEFEAHMKRSWADYKKDIDARLKEVESSNSQTVAKLRVYGAQAIKLEELTQNAELALAGLNEKISTEVKKVIGETNAEILKQEVERLKAVNKEFYRSIEIKVKAVRADLITASANFETKVSNSESKVAGMVSKSESKFADVESKVAGLYSGLQVKLDEVYKEVHSLSYFMGFFEENHPHIIKIMTLDPAEKQLLINLHERYNGDSEKMLHALKSEIGRLDSRNQQGLDTIARRAAPQQLVGLLDYQTTHLDKEGEPVSLYQIREQLKAWGKYVVSLKVLRESLPKELFDAEKAK